MEAVMAFEQLQAEISLLLNQINEQPEDLHELYEMLHQKLNEMRATGQPLPQDLVELEQKLLRDFPKAAASKKS
jgi:predicted  nucleic acid-binding Zn-ribbon protein